MLANIFFDQNPKTFGEMKNTSANYELVFEVNKPIVAMSYLPRQDGKTAGNIFKYKIQSSEDGRNWKDVKSGEFSNINANPVEQVIDFGTKVSSKYLKLVPLETDSKVLTVSEIYFYE